jgi:predicted XRE-type DNA-binding protein
MHHLKDKLLSQIEVREDGCWLFTGGKQSQGYGMIYDATKKGNVRAHIISYTIHVETIPKGLLVLHKCDNPWCVNPEHLFLGTHQDNVDDMRIKGRDAFGENKGEKNGQAKLTEDNVKVIKRLLSTKQYTQEQIADMFGVSRKAINMINLHQTWRHI